MSRSQKFVELFGDTVPGKAGGDISRDGNLQSPMYGTYAAKAFLVSNVAPLTYIRVLGEQKTGTSTAGWKTSNQPNNALPSNGGAYGLWLFPSASLSSKLGGTPTRASMGTGSLAGIDLVLNSGSTISLSGTLWGAGNNLDTAEGIGKVIVSDSNNLFTVRISSSVPIVDEKITFGFSDSNENFVRKAFNTNPQLASAAGTFYAADSAKACTTSESYEQEIRDANLESAAALGVIMPIADSTAHTTIGPAIKKIAHREAYTGWVIGQDLKGVAGDFDVQAQRKLFRLIGRSHG